jgi:hypothetical protein
MAKNYVITQSDRSVREIIAERVFSLEAFSDRTVVEADCASLSVTEDRCALRDIDWVVSVV